MVFSDMNERLHKMWLLAETTMHTAILRDSSPLRFNLDQFQPGRMHHDGLEKQQTSAT
jgi:hypothetical protein